MITREFVSSAKIRIVSDESLLISHSSSTFMMMWSGASSMDMSGQNVARVIGGTGASAVANGVVADYGIGALGAARAAVTNFEVS